MTIKTLTAIALAAFAMAGAAQAQDAAGTRASIMVMGEGHVDAAPDTFSMTADVEGRGADQAEAVRQMTRVQTAVTDGVSHLNGLTAAHFSTGLPSVQPVYAADCQNIAYNRPGACPVTGYVAAMTLSLEGRPAERGGDAVSLAAETGARSTRLTTLTLSDDRAFQRQAAQAAFADARRQADDIALAAGQRVVRVAKVQNPDSPQGSLTLELGGPIQRDRVFGYAGAPIVLTPGPVTIQSRLVVTFEIE